MSPGSLPGQERSAVDSFTCLPLPVVLLRSRTTRGATASTEVETLRVQPDPPGLESSVCYGVSTAKHRAARRWNEKSRKFVQISFVVTKNGNFYQVEINRK